MPNQAASVARSKMPQRRSPSQDHGACRADQATVVHEIRQGHQIDIAEGGLSIAVF